MPKEVRKEWTYDICQLTFLSEKILNLHLQGKKHKTTEALKSKNQPNIVPTSTTKKIEQLVEEPQKTVSTKEWKQRTTTKNEGEQHAQLQTPYFVHPRFACRTLKIPKVLSFLYGATETSKLTQRNPFGHQRTQSAFSSQIAYGQPQVD